MNRTHIGFHPIGADRCEVCNEYILRQYEGFFCMCHANGGKWELVRVGLSAYEQEELARMVLGASSDMRRSLTQNSANERVDVNEPTEAEQEEAYHAHYQPAEKKPRKKRKKETKPRYPCFSSCCGTRYRRTRNGSCQGCRLPQ